MYKGTLSLNVLRFLSIFAVASLLSLYLAKDCFAARSITISSIKDSLFGDEEAIITATLSGFADGETIYIKGAFYQEGTTNYFGYTKNGDNWIKNGISTTSQKQIKIGEWDGSLNIKSDFADSGYKGEGTYKFKVGFYYTTSGGNLSSVNWSANTVDVDLNEPDPTPTPTPSPTSTSSSPYTSAKTPSPSPKTSPTSIIKSPDPSPQLLPEVLGVKSQEINQDPPSSQSPFASTNTKIQSSSTQAKLAAILTGLGLILIASSIGFFFWYKKVMGSSHQNKEGEEVDRSQN